MKKAFLLAVWLCVLPMFGQTASRYEGNIYTINSSAPLPGGLYPVLAYPGATIAICNAPANAVPCTNYATTYTNASEAGICSAPAQLTRDNSTTCVSPADAEGGFGVWMAGGTYQYTVSTAYGNYGPYDFSVGSGGSGGVTLPFPGLVYATSAVGGTVATSPQIVAALNTTPSTLLATALLPVATGSTFGTIKPDNTTCTVASGVLSCTGSLTGAALLNPTSPQTITYNTNGPNELKLLNSNTGTSAQSAYALSNGSQQAIFSLSGTNNSTPNLIGFGGTTSGLGMQLQTINAPMTLLTTASSTPDLVLNAATTSATFGYNVIAPSYATNGAANGNIGLTATGTAPSSASANTILVQAPNSVTAYGLELPGAQPTSGNTYLSCTAANPSVCTWAAGGSGGSGTVTSFSAPAGSWPSWLVPTVTTATTTPSLAVAASAIPYSALAPLSANTVLGALTATAPSGLAMPSCSGSSNALIWTTGTGFGCNTISGATGAIVQNPASTAANTIAPTATGVVGLTINCISGITVNCWTFGNLNQDQYGNLHTPSVIDSPGAFTFNASTYITLQPGKNSLTGITNIYNTYKGSVASGLVVDRSTSADSTVVACPASCTDAIGIAEGTSGAFQNVQSTGQPTLTFDGTYTVTDAEWVCTSPTTAGEVMPQSAQCPNGRTVGQIVTAATSVTSAPVALQIGAAGISSGSGTVTSVAQTVPSWLSIAGSPITGSGTLAITAASGQTANEFLATPNGSSGAVGLRAIVSADIPWATPGAIGSTTPNYGYFGGAVISVVNSSLGLEAGNIYSFGANSTTIGSAKIIGSEGVGGSAFDNYLDCEPSADCTFGNTIVAPFGFNSSAIPLSCQPGIGDGLNAIPAGTYLTTSCRNETGQTWTIAAIRCVADSGSSTCNVTNGAGTGLLTGAITGTSTYANGTQSATTTIASGDYLKITFVADGTSKQIGIDVTGTY